MNGSYIPPSQRRDAIERITGGYPDVNYRGDPGHQPPMDPITGEPVDVVRGRVSTVIRDVPILTIQNAWSIDQVRGALYQNMWGYFFQSGQLIDSMLGDDRVQATLGSRIGGLFGRELITEPANDSAAAREVLDAWRDTAEDLCGGWALTETAVYGIMQGFAHGQLVWDTSQPIWRPHAIPWHPMYEWYDWQSRKYVAISQDGSKPILNGDGKWYGHLPYGSYRAWVRAAMRAVAEPWVIRHFAIRDWAGFSEIHGFPQRIGNVPAAAEPAQRAAFEQSLASMGSNTAMIIPQGVDGQSIGYDYKLVEATATAWESFPGLRDHCDLAIVLAIKFQNLTTEITSGGSYAAAKEHGKGDVAQVAADNRAWMRTLRHDFARPFAYLNFGDADLAPITRWDVPEPPREDYAANSDAFTKLAQAVAQLAQAGFKFTSSADFEAFARSQMGVRLPKSFSIGDSPAIVTALAADKTAAATHKSADATVMSAMPSDTPEIALTSTDVAIVVTVNEVRCGMGLPPIEDGELTVAEYKAKHADIVKESVTAEQSDVSAHQEPDGDEQ